MTATSGSAAGSATVTVSQAAATVRVTAAADTLVAIGDTVRLTAEALDANGHAVAGAGFAWASGDTLVATVDGTGLVTAVGDGSASVTATSGSAQGSATVTVSQAAATVRVTAAADTLVAIGDTVRLTAEALDANGHAVAGAEFAWASGDTLVVTVDGTGLVTAVGVGSASVTATSGSAQGSATVTVSQAATLMALYHSTGGLDWTRSGQLGHGHPAGRVARRHDR